MKIVTDCAADMSVHELEELEVVQAPLFIQFPEGAVQVKDEVQVSHWDTLTLSGGERFQVIAAALASKAGWAMHTIQEKLTVIREKTELIYTLDTLEYLARGGRIGRVQAIAGALLNLKPVIRVDSDGKYSTVATNRTL